MIKGVLCLITLFVAKSAWAEHILYVDGVGADPGTYATIQDAIDAATQGDVIEVVAGTYSLSSPLNINIHNLTLRNKEGNKPVIQPSANFKYSGAPNDLPGPAQKIGIKSYTGLIHIHNANNITLKGFEIKNPETVSSLHGVVVTNSSNTVITDNIITGFMAGLYIDEYSHDQEIQKNTITNNDTGVIVLHSTNIAINVNNIFDNDEYDLVYGDNENIDATCNWWGSTDLNKINDRILNIAEGSGDQATWIPISENKDLPCLYKMFKMEIIIKEQNEQ